MGVTASIATAVVAASSTGYSISKQQQAGRDASRAADKATADAKAMADADTTKALQAGKNAQLMAQQRASAAGGPFGQGGTILTGPQGVTNPVTPGKKTLLGM